MKVAARFRVCVFLSMLLLLPAALLAQQAGSLPPGGMSLHDFAAKWMMQQGDLADTGFWADDNARLAATSDRRARVVLFGDSITFHWKDLPVLPGAVFLNRGIPGQNSSQMLLRFTRDVVALGADVVVIMAGTNDLRVYAGDRQAAAAAILDRLRHNIMAMSAIASASGIRVILTEIPPFSPARDHGARDPSTWRSANDWLRDFANRRHLPLIDYAPVLADTAGSIRPDLSEDGLHPNAAAYQRMKPLLAEAVTQNLAENNK